MQNPYFNNLFNLITHIITLTSLFSLMIMYDMDIMYCSPEDENIGVNENMYKHDKLCHCHCGVNGMEYNFRNKLK